MPIGRQTCQICPYYTRDSEYSITCEGVIEGAVCAHRFAGPVAKRTHQVEYCESYNYKQCPWAKVLEQIAAERGGELRRCNLSDGCPYARPRKSCCRTCEFRDCCPAPEYRCDNTPERCGYAVPLKI